MLFIALVALGVVILAATRWQAARSIGRVNVVGTSLIRTSEIIDIVLQAPKNNTSASSSGTPSQTLSTTLSGKFQKAYINTDEIARRVEKHPFVKSATVFIGASDAITVEVEERVPIAFVMMKGKQFYLDHDARILPYRLTESVLDLPVIAALGRAKLDSTRLAEVLGILQAVEVFDKEQPEAEKHRQAQPLSQMLSEIDVLPNGDYTLRLTKYSTPIRFGRVEHKEAKIARLAAFLSHCAENKVEVHDCKYVDVRWEHQIVLFPALRAMAHNAHE
ncbi:MAG: hypothetical protein EAZ92_05310 [Candidatus Kapaibacterium sp.]|nr:MAG: hypothetical protein EAZ92_05310 [Candidatus Kapabacteria bacterium]